MGREAWFRPPSRAMDLIEPGLDIEQRARDIVALDGPGRSRRKAQAMMYALLLNLSHDLQPVTPGVLDALRVALSILPRPPRNLPGDQRFDEELGILMDAEEVEAFRLIEQPRATATVRRAAWALVARRLGEWLPVLLANAVGVVLGACTPRIDEGVFSLLLHTQQPDEFLEVVRYDASVLHRTGTLPPASEHANEDDEDAVDERTIRKWRANPAHQRLAERFRESWKANETEEAMFDTWRLYIATPEERQRLPAKPWSRWSDDERREAIEAIRFAAAMVVGARKG